MENIEEKVYRLLLFAFDLTERVIEDGYDDKEIVDKHGKVLGEDEYLSYPTRPIVLENRYNIGFPQIVDGVNLYGDGSIRFYDKNKNEMFGWNNFTDESEEMIYDCVWDSLKKDFSHIDIECNNKIEQTLDNHSFTTATKEYGDWNDCSYEPIYADNGDIYQFYAFEDKNSGKRYVQLAKYVADGCYVSLDEILPYFKNNKHIVEGLFPSRNER